MTALGLVVILVAGACSVLPDLPSTPATMPDVPLTVRLLGPDGPVTGTRVCAGSPRGVDQRCAVSGPDGQATLPVRPGLLTVRPDDAASGRLRPFGNVSLEAAGPSIAVVLYERRVRITGRVSAIGGRPVAGASVCAHPVAEGRLPAIECVRTGTDGRYDADLPAGIYLLRVDGPDDGSRLIAQWAHGRVAAHEAERLDARQSDLEERDIVLRPGVVLSGTVRAADDGRPVAEAQVCTLTLATAMPWDCLRTDRHGRYQALREPGSYWLWVIPPDGAGRLLPQRHDRVDRALDATAVTLESDRTIDVGLREGPLIRGRITTEQGRPVPHAVVCLDTPFPSGRICRPADEAGAYSIATRPETYLMQVIPPERSDAVGAFWPAARDAQGAGRLRVSGDVIADVVLARGVRLSGTVRTEDGFPVEGAPLTVGDADGFVAGAFTDERGRYGVAVPPGRYTVDVFGPRAGRLVSRVGTVLTVESDTGFDVVLEWARP